MRSQHCLTATVFLCRNFGEASAEAMRRCLGERGLGGLRGGVGRNRDCLLEQRKFRRAMPDLAVAFEPISEEATVKAAEALRRYRLRGGRRSRIASDFLIGSHALSAADRLLTRDQGFYPQYFAGLKLMDPSA
jgi:hypothetical protein